MCPFDFRGVNGGTGVCLGTWNGALILLRGVGPVGRSRLLCVVVGGRLWCGKRACGAHVTKRS